MKSVSQERTVVRGRELKPPSNAERSAVKSAMRVLEILELLTRQARPMSFSECQHMLGYPKASLHGLLRTMERARWIELDPATKTYVLGVRTWEAGNAYTARLPLASCAMPAMERLRDLTTETVQLAVLDDFEVLYIAKVDGAHMLRLDSSVGLRLQPHATGVGKVLLAALDDARLENWVRSQKFERYTPYTITAADALLDELRWVRDHGYARDQEERTLGARCVAVGITNHSGTLVAAMSVSAPAVRFGEAQRDAALIHLHRAAAAVSSALGSPPLDLAAGRRVAATEVTKRFISLP